MWRGRRALHIAQARVELGEDVQRADHLALAARWQLAVAAEEWVVGVRAVHVACDLLQDLIVLPRRRTLSGEEGGMRAVAAKHSRYASERSSPLCRILPSEG